MRSAWRQLMASAANLNAARFRTLAAASLIATSAIVGSALAGDERGVLAALLASARAQQTAEADAPGPPAGAEGPSLPAAPVPGGPSAPSPSAAPAPAPAPAAAQPGSASSAPPGESTTAEEEGASEETTPETPTPAAGTGPVKHVFVISLTSPGYERTFGEASFMPYLNGTLRPAGTLLSEYSLLTETGLPNRIATISGQPPNALTEAGCEKYVNHPDGTTGDASGVVKTPGCIYPVDVQTIADQVNAGGLTWHAYMEDMVGDAGPANCVHPGFDETEVSETGGYSAKQNPFTFFHSLLDLGACGANDVPLDELQKDLKKATTTPNYSYIAPNLCNAGVAGQCPGATAPETPEEAARAAGAADAFLEDWVPRIRESAAYRKAGALLITFGEANAATAEPEPTRVGTVLLSKLAPAGASVGTPYDPYSLLRSTEDLLGLDPLANAGAVGTESFASQLAAGGD